jgi:hypothetical protein
MIRRRRPVSKTTTVVAYGQAWDVPRGFGALYRQITSWHQQMLADGKPGMVITSIQGLLGLIGYEVSAEAVADWSARKRTEAYVYAYNVHARASDVPLPRYPKPRWLPEPWKGPELGPEASFMAGARTGTVLL